MDGRASNTYTDKWCVQPVLIIQLPKTQIASGWRINKIVVKHAGFAGENPASNTREFSVGVRQWQVCSAQVPLLGSLMWFGYTPNNTAEEAVIYNDRDNVDQVQLRVLAPTQGTGGATRIYEVEVWGTPSTTNVLENCYNPLGVDA